jgi:phosphoglycolate phosphatase-like HAD superfamily hydrolase
MDKINNLFFDKIKLIFWDFDGVIKESVNIKTDCFLELFKDINQEIKNKIKLHHLEHGGVSRYEKIPLYLKLSGIPYDHKILQDYYDRFHDIVIEKVVQAEWVPGVLQVLNSGSYINVLVSATPIDELNEIVERINIKHFFTEIYGAPTNKINAIEDFFSKFNHNKLETIFIGDSMVDKIAADQCQVQFILRKHDYTENRLKDYKGKIIYNFL